MIHAWQMYRGWRVQAGRLPDCDMLFPCMQAGFVHASTAGITLTACLGQTVPHWIGMWQATMAEASWRCTTSRTQARPCHWKPSQRYVSVKWDQAVFGSRCLGWILGREYMPSRTRSMLAAIFLDNVGGRSAQITLFMNGDVGYLTAVLTLFTSANLTSPHSLHRPCMAGGQRSVTRVPAAMAPTLPPGRGWRRAGRWSRRWPGQTTWYQGSLSSSSSRPPRLTRPGSCRGTFPSCEPKEHTLHSLGPFPFSLYNHHWADVSKRQGRTPSKHCQGGGDPGALQRHRDCSPCACGVVTAVPGMPFAMQGCPASGSSRRLM